MKKALFILILLSGFTSHLLAQPIVSLPDTFAMRGEITRIPITLETGVDNFVGFELSLSYDPARVTISPHYDGSLISGWLRAENHTSGRIRLAAATVSNDATASGTLLFVDVQVSSEHSSAPISLDKVVINETVASVVHGSVTIIGEDATLLTTQYIQAIDGFNGRRDTLYVRLSESGLTVAPIIRVTHKGDTEEVKMSLKEPGVYEGFLPTVFSSSPSSDGVLQVNVTPEELGEIVTQRVAGALIQQRTSTVVYVLGDVTGNGLLNPVDASAALDMTTGILPATMLADVDGDGEVSSNDAALILRRVVELITLFPRQAPWFF